MYVSQMSIQSLHRMKEIMKEDNEKKNRYESVIQENTKNANSKKSFSLNISLREIVIGVAITVIASIITGGFSAYILINNSLTEMNASIQSLSSTVETNDNALQSQIDLLTESINGRMDSVESRMTSLENRMSSLEARMGQVELMVYNRVYPITQTALQNFTVQTEDYYTPQFLSCPTWNSYDVVSVDDNGEKYTAEELIGEKILFEYTENGQEIVFFGQYNDLNNWDGNCLLNIYENNQLIMINDVIFNDGKILSYKQVLADTSKGKNIWVVGNRECDVNHNSGNTSTYLRKQTVEKQFSSDKISKEDLLFFDSFVSDLKEENILSYYYGNTSNGKYNDDTGSAYLIKYDDVGNVITLYNGNFKNGIFNDNTYNAWYITKSENSDYMYYKGVFEDGSTKPDKKSVFQNNLTEKQINQLIDEKIYNSPLKWDFNIL